LFWVKNRFEEQDDVIVKKICEMRGKCRKRNQQEKAMVGLWSLFLRLRDDLEHETTLQQDIEGEEQWTRGGNHTEAATDGSSGCELGLYLEHNVQDREDPEADKVLAIHWAETAEVEDDLESTLRHPTGRGFWLAKKVEKWGK
jgi:hypothetical protein